MAVSVPDVCLPSVPEVCLGSLAPPSSLCPSPEKTKTNSPLPFPLSRSLILRLLGAGYDSF